MLQQFSVCVISTLVATVISYIVNLEGFRWLCPDKPLGGGDPCLSSNPIRLRRSPRRRDLLRMDLNGYIGLRGGRRFNKKWVMWGDNGNRKQEGSWFCLFVVQHFLQGSWLLLRSCLIPEFEDFPSLFKLAPEKPAGSLVERKRILVIDGYGAASVLEDQCHKLHKGQDFPSIEEIPTVQEDRIQAGLF